MEKNKFKKGIKTGEKYILKMPVYDGCEKWTPLKLKIKKYYYYQKR